jgi:hypothetical protein
MFTPPEGWPQQATFPPTRDDRRMYQAFSESIDNKTVTVQFIPAYGGGRFTVPKQEEEPEIDYDEEEDDDALGFMPPPDSPGSPDSPDSHHLLSSTKELMEQIGRDGDNFDPGQMNEPAWHATPPQCPRSRPDYPSLNDGNKPCTVNTTRNIGGGTKPKYRYMCQLCKFEWQQEREINKFTKERRKALEEDIIVTDSTWLGKLPKYKCSGVSKRAPIRKHENVQKKRIPSKCGECFKNYNLIFWKAKMGDIDKHSCIKSKYNKETELNEFELEEWKKNEIEKQKAKEALFESGQHSTSQYPGEIAFRRIPIHKRKYNIDSIQKLNPYSLKDKLGWYPLFGKVTISKNKLIELFDKPYTFKAPTHIKIPLSQAFHAVIRYSKSEDSQELREARLLIHDSIDTKISDPNILSDWNVCSTNYEIRQLINEINS